MNRESGGDGLDERSARLYGSLAFGLLMADSGELPTGAAADVMAQAAIELGTPGSWRLLAALEADLGPFTPRLERVLRGMAAAAAPIGPSALVSIDDTVADRIEDAVVELVSQLPDETAAAIEAASAIPLVDPAEFDDLRRVLPAADEVPAFARPALLVLRFRLTQAQPRAPPRAGALGRLSAAEKELVRPVVLRLWDDVAAGRRVGRVVRNDGPLGHGVVADDEVVLVLGRATLVDGLVAGDVDAATASDIVSRMLAFGWLDTTGAEPTAVTVITDDRFELFLKLGLLGVVVEHERWFHHADGEELTEADELDHGNDVEERIEVVERAVEVRLERVLSVAVDANPPAADLDRLVAALDELAGSSHRDVRDLAAQMRSWLEEAWRDVLLDHGRLATEIETEAIARWAGWMLAAQQAAVDGVPFPARDALREEGRRAGMLLPELELMADFSPSARAALYLAGRRADRLARLTEVVDVVVPEFGGAVVVDGFSVLDQKELHATLVGLRDRLRPLPGVDNAVVADTGEEPSGFTRGLHLRLVGTTWHGIGEPGTGVLVVTSRMLDEIDGHERAGRLRPGYLERVSAAAAGTVDELIAARLAAEGRTAAATPARRGDAPPASGGMSEAELEWHRVYPDETGMLRRARDGLPFRTAADPNAVRWRDGLFRATFVIDVAGNIYAGAAEHRQYFNNVNHEPAGVIATSDAGAVLDAKRTRGRRADELETVDIPLLARFAAAGVDVSRAVPDGLHGTLPPADRRLVLSAFRLAMDEGAGRTVRSQERDGAGLLARGQVLFLVDEAVLVEVFGRLQVDPARAAELIESFDAAAWHDLAADVGVIGMVAQRHEELLRHGMLPVVVEHEQLHHLGGHVHSESAHAADVAWRAGLIGRALGERPVDRYAPARLSELIGAIELGEERPGGVDAATWLRVALDGLGRYESDREVASLREELLPLFRWVPLMRLQRALDLLELEAFGATPSAADRWWLDEQGQLALRWAAATYDAPELVGFPELAQARSARDGMLLRLLAYRGAPDRTGVWGTRFDPVTEEFGAAVARYTEVRMGLLRDAQHTAKAVVTRVGELLMIRPPGRLPVLRAAADALHGLLTEATTGPVTAGELAAATGTLTAARQGTARTIRRDPHLDMALTDLDRALERLFWEDATDSTGALARLRAGRGALDAGMTLGRGRFEERLEQLPAGWHEQRRTAVRRVLERHERVGWLELFMEVPADVQVVRLAADAAEAAYTGLVTDDVTAVAGIAHAALELRRRVDVAEEFAAAVLAGPAAVTALLVMARAGLAVAIEELDPYSAGGWERLAAAAYLAVQRHPAGAVPAAGPPVAAADAADPGRSAARQRSSAASTRAMQGTARERAPPPWWRRIWAALVMRRRR